MNTAPVIIKKLSISMVLLGLDCRRAASIHRCQIDDDVERMGLQELGTIDFRGNNENTLAKMALCSKKKPSRLIKRKNNCIILFLSFALLTLTCLINAQPVAYWAMQPVGPDETVVAAAANVDPRTRVELARLADVDPTTSPELTLSEKTEATPLKISQSSVFFLIPKTWDDGVYAFRLKTGGIVGNTQYINRPDVYFISGDSGDFATPGGWLQVHGTAIALPKARKQQQPVLKLRNDRDVEILLHANPRDSLNNGYRQRFAIPENLPEGNYKVSVHNGHGGSLGWVSYQSITYDGKPITTVSIRKTWVPRRTIQVTLGSTDDVHAKLSAALAEARNAGGATVLLPAGHFVVGKPLVIPDHVVLRGVGSGKTVLHWPDRMAGIANSGILDTAITGEMVTRDQGATFGVADLSLDLGADCNPAIGLRRSTGGSFISDISIEHPNTHGADAINTITEKRPWGYASCFPGIWLNECSNVTITGCLINASTPIHPHASSALRIDKNTLRWRHYLSHVNARCDRLVFENNRFVFPGLLDEGVKTGGWEPRLYFTARFQNQRDVYMGFNTSESEILQNANFNGFFGHDTSGGGYVGSVEKADEKTGTLTLPTPLRSINPGALVQILSGKGAGQFRYAAPRAARDTPELPVLEPWDVVPDKTSIVVLRNTQGRFLVINNDLPFDGRWSNYFTSHDVIIAGNKLGAATVDGKGRGLMNYEFVGFTSANQKSIGGFTTMLRNQVIDNWIVRQGFNNTGNYPLKEPPFAGYGGPTLTYVAYRNNKPAVGESPKSFDFTLPILQGEGLVFENNEGLTKIRANNGTWGKPSVGVFRNNTGASGKQVNIQFPKDYTPTPGGFPPAQ